MKRICYILITWFLLPSLVAVGQSIVPAITVGWGEYSMKELKELEYYFNSPVQLRSVNRFPPYVFFKASVLYDIKKVQFGFSWGHYSTGARNHYRDYSGEISIKQLIHADVYSFPFYLKTNNKNRLIFSFMFEPGIISTKYTLLEEIRLWDESSYQKYSDHLTTLSLQPGLKFTYTTKRWQPSIDFGYFFDTKLIVETEFRTINIIKEESDYFDFSGLRISFSLAYKIDL
jgi:hypothetical protein